MSRALIGFLAVVLGGNAHALTAVTVTSPKPFTLAVSPKPIASPVGSGGTAYSGFTTPQRTSLNTQISNLKRSKYPSKLPVLDASCKQNSDVKSKLDEYVLAFDNCLNPTSALSGTPLKTWSSTTYTSNCGSDSNPLQCFARKQEASCLRHLTLKSKWSTVEDQCNAFKNDLVCGDELKKINELKTQVQSSDTSLNTDEMQLKSASSEGLNLESEITKVDQEIAALLKKKAQLESEFEQKQAQLQKVQSDLSTKIKRMDSALADRNAKQEKLLASVNRSKSYKCTIPTISSSILQVRKPLQLKMPTGSASLSSTRTLSSTSSATSVRRLSTSNKVDLGVGTSSGGQTGINPVSPTKSLNP